MKTHSNETCQEYCKGVWLLAGDDGGESTLIWLKRGLEGFLGGSLWEIHFVLAFWIRLNVVRCSSEMEACLAFTWYG